ncbi:hypothetical protein RJ640_017189 [Escallonia rubra]|uniref:Uncharacterized protein n=1 Tax=Escallonia rubra TaxID=112253 RepID=A0AA88RQP8_9ASTE|nr:hypothetical protein RJ640_017189 [Escallonia rubra]
MDWFYPKRRGPEWKQGWTSQTLYSISTPPLPLLAIFAIVVFLLSISQYTNYKSQLNNTMINFQVLQVGGSTSGFRGLGKKSGTELGPRLGAQRPQQPTTVATNASVPAILESANIY